MRNITHIVIHCTATPQSATVESLQRYWKDVKKWKSPGYHRVVRPDGSVAELLAISAVSNGVAGHNSTIINISYIGGVDAAGKPCDNRTQAQKATLIRLIKEFKTQFPAAKVCGHRDFPNVAKACPSFNAIPEYSHL